MDDDYKQRCPFFLLGLTYSNTEASINAKYLNLLEEYCHHSVPLDESSLFLHLICTAKARALEMLSSDTVRLAPVSDATRAHDDREAEDRRAAYYASLRKAPIIVDGPAIDPITASQKECPFMLLGLPRASAETAIEECWEMLMEDTKTERVTNYIRRTIYKNAKDREMPNCMVLVAL